MIYSVLDEHGRTVEDDLESWAVAERRAAWLTKSTRRLHTVDTRDPRDARATG